MCSAPNPPGARSCRGCGVAFYVRSRPWTPDEAHDIARVRTGLLLAAFGIVLGWFLDFGAAGAFLAVSMGPGLAVLAFLCWLVGLAGLILLVVGALLVLLGRRPFEYTMGGKAALALLLLAGGALLTVGADQFLLGRVPGFQEAPDPLGVAWMFKSVLMWGFVFPALGALGALLLGYDLQDEKGLRIGFLGVLAFAAAGLAGTAAGWVWIDILSQNPFAPAFLGALGPALLPQQLLMVAWRVVFAVLFLRTSRRIALGEVPVPPDTGGPAPAPV